ncbi:hypothetical protein TRIP_B40348 [uncultured Desulfatiglans sp.]|uniref:Uncharacterized protein n=1 Tax=Uncultured Desulfatiglans sp. TaxID=1748965 RepID=A0A653AFV0_UNCDX|nr:hypothetical protein TRIP_B40348 [uncultured Desulfatiglans sp.]
MDSKKFGNVAVISLCRSNFLIPRLPYRSQTTQNCVQEHYNPLSVNLAFQEVNLNHNCPTMLLQRTAKRRAAARGTLGR